MFAYFFPDLNTESVLSTALIVVIFVNMMEMSLAATEEYLIHSQYLRRGGHGLTVA